ncbi:protein-disulfide isomerase [Cellulophaga geojensis KL-A]|uniref:Protein-disulfide isomerase n=1 Tax=Cellulophaga geojensis KL-A TaxID=1328323 RepID=A0ABP3B4L4_9FLAO|nr:vitamin K epoxide reductase family protein [Cellulophaga geojensis]EWH12771.1 protein-disulfide isomerase [Cellulophaga geojensis KL-A]
MNNYLTTTQKILDLLQIKSTKKFISESLESHPDYPSLLSITDTLDKYNIETLGIKIKEERLEEVPLPCIAQVEVNNTPLFYAITEIDSNTITYFDENNKIANESKDSFLKKWTGICLLVEKTEQSKEPNIEQTLAKKKTLTLFATIIGLLLSLWLVFSFLQTASGSASSNVLMILYTSLKMIGLATAVFLLWFEVDKYNPTLQNFCSGGKKVSCDQVLNSKHAYILNGTVSISAVTFGYFFASITLLVTSGFSSSALALLNILSVLAIPAIIYSLYTQAVVIKKWCKFCIVILTVLAVENLLTFFTGGLSLSINIPDTLLFFALLITPIPLWTLLKPRLEKGKETTMLKRSLQKIKNNKTVFESLHAKSDKIKTNPEGLGLLLKSENPKYHIIKVCNPYCGPCASAHPILDELYHKGIIDLQILFTASADETDRKYAPVNHLLAIDTVNSTDTAKALDDWYMADIKDYENFANKYPLNGELKEQKHKIQKMNDWCKAENIMYTPTIYVNGYKLTNEYTIEDLKEVLQ